MAKKPADPDAEDQPGTTFSEYSKAIENGATMDEGDPVEYDPMNSSYPKGTMPGTSKEWAKNADAELQKGFNKPVYAEGGGPQKANF